MTRRKIILYRFAAVLCLLFAAATFATHSRGASACCLRTLGFGYGDHFCLGRRMIRATEDNRQVEVEFPYTPQKPGHYRLTMRADPQPDEQVEYAGPSAVVFRANFDYQTDAVHGNGLEDAEGYTPKAPNGTPIFLPFAEVINLRQNDLGNDMPQGDHFS